MTQEEFYSSHERVMSRELDFGVWWRDGGTYPNYRITWVEATGEVISVDQRSMDYQILGVVDSEEKIEALLKGWANKCGDKDSLDWVKTQIAL